MIEMLVVVGVITVLIGMVLVVGRGALNDAKVKQTQVMMRQLQNAINAVRDENPYSSVTLATQRYGPYPPDDLMAFTPKFSAGGSGHGLGGSFDDMPNLMPGGMGQYVKRVGGAPLVIHDDFDLVADAYVANGDIKALVWSLRQHPKSREIYESIPAPFRVTVDTELEFFDMSGDDDFDSLLDKEVQYLVDGWGNPLEYYAAKQLREGTDPDDALPTEATSHGWVSQNLVQINKNLPVVVSYGPNGDVQLQANQTLQEQYNYNVIDGNGIVGDPVFDPIQLHEDNVYLDEALAERITSITIPP